MWGVCGPHGETLAAAAVAAGAPIEAAAGSNPTPPARGLKRRRESGELLTKALRAGPDPRTCGE